MSWKRLATFVVGGGLVALGAFVPVAGTAAVAAGMGLIGWATKWPGDKPTAPKPPTTP